MIKELFVILLVISLSSSTVVSNTTTNRAHFTNSAMNDISFYTHSFSITSSNASTTFSDNVLAGSIFGGNTNYMVVASIIGTATQQVRLLFSRGSETVFFSLDSQSPNWHGKISFSGCCSNVLENLYVQLQLEQNSTVIQNVPNFLVAYSIYKYQESTSSSIDIFGSSNNDLGYVYPTRNYIIGLMILLIGMIPVSLMVLFLRKYLRKKKNFLSKKKV